MNRDESWQVIDEQRVIIADRLRAGPNSPSSKTTQVNLGLAADRSG